MNQLEIFYDESIIDEDGVVSIVGIINNKKFKYNVHYVMGFSKDIYENLTIDERLEIVSTYQDNIITIK